MIRSLLAMAALSVGLLLSAAAATMPNDRFDDALTHPGRPAADRTRDAIDHPDQLLRLTGMKSAATVVDVLAGDGYFSELSSYLVGAQGKVLLLNNKAFEGWSDGLDARLAGGRLPNVTRVTRELDDLQLPPESVDVALLVNGVVALDDSSYPFELSAALPSLASTPSGTVTLALRATDTAGLVATTAPVTVTLTPDTTTPTLLDQTLQPGSVHAGSFRSFTYRFSKPIDAASLTTANFTLTGPAGAVIPTSIQSRAGGLQVVVTYPALVPGSYTSTLVAAGITDRAGHALGAAPLTTAFTVAAGSYTAEWTSLLSGNWSNPYSWGAGNLPLAADKVLLSLPAGVVVTHDRASDEIAGLAVSAGEFAMTGGSLTVNGALDAIGGTVTLAGGTLSNAAIQAESGTVLFKSISLGNVSVSTAMTVRGNSSTFGSFVLTGPVLDLLTTDFSGNGLSVQTSL